MINKQDEELLSLLRENARTSVSDLARELHLSRSTVQNRITKLEQSGVIKGYSVDYGSEYLDDLVSAHVLIKENPKLVSKTNLELKRIAQIVDLYVISGEYDLIAVVQAQSLNKLNTVLEQIGNLNGVERTNSSVILTTKFKR
jgi:DNA-binding Lrp family transcriptional regulator